MMKYVLLIHLLIILIVYSCRELKMDRIRQFIPGTYIRFAEHEFGKEYDTLVITMQNSDANEYNILRKWRYERVPDGRPIEPEYKQFRTSGIYDPESRLLREVQSLHVYSFDVKRKLLFKGPIKYQKL